MTQNQTTSNKQLFRCRGVRYPCLLARVIAFVALLAMLACGGRPPPPVPPATSPQPPVSKTPVDALETPTVGPPKLEAHIEPPLIRVGESALLTWKATNADRVVINHNIGPVETSGRIRFFPEVTTHYEVVAEGAGGTVTANVTVEVLTNEIVSEGNLTGQPLRERFDNFVKPVFFEYDSAKLTPETIAMLDETIRWLSLPKNRQLHFLIEGHCDQRGTEEYNLALGDKRAQIVRAHMLARGISGSRIKTFSLGEERPFDPRQMKQAWALNRRAHFTLTEGL